MPTTTQENAFIVYLLVSRKPHAHPRRPESIDRGLSPSLYHRFHRATTGRQIYAMKAVKAHRVFQIARPNKIALMNVARMPRHKARIFFTLWLVSPLPSNHLIVSDQDASDRTNGGGLSNLEVFQLPLNSLRTKEHALFLQTLTHCKYG